MTLRGGKLRHRVRIDELVPVEDSNGDPTQDPATGALIQEWVTVATVWAAIEPLSARELIQSAAMQSAVSARLVIRYRAGLHAAMRFVHVVNGADGTIYNPAGMLADKESGLEYLTIPVSAGVNNGQ